MFTFHHGNISPIVKCTNMNHIIRISLFDIYHVVFLTSVLQFAHLNLSTASCFVLASKLEATSSRATVIWSHGDLHSMRYLTQPRANYSEHIVPEPDFVCNSTQTITPKFLVTNEITDIVVHKVKETVSHTGTLTSVRMVVEHFVKRMERLSERAFERVTERTMERVTERTLAKQALKRTTENTLERLIERLFDRFGERTIERAGERVLERAGEKVLGRAGERALERASERILERGSERVLERAGERIVERATERTLNRIGRKNFLKYFSRSVIRIGRGLTIALPVLGGLFALYLFHADVQRVQVELEKQQTLQGSRSDKYTSMNHASNTTSVQSRINISAIVVILLFIGTGIVDIFDAFVHFWIAYGLFLSHHGNMNHHWMEQISLWCSILSTIFAILGEVFSYRIHNPSSSSKRHVEEGNKV